MALAQVIQHGLWRQYVASCRSSISQRTTRHPAACTSRIAVRIASSSVAASRWNAA